MLKRGEKSQDSAGANWQKMSLPHGADWDHWLEAETRINAGPLAGRDPKKANTSSAKSAAHKAS